MHEISATGQNCPVIVDRTFIILIIIFTALVVNFLYLTTGYPMPQAPQQQQGGLQPSPGQKAALDSFQNQAKPFGWLVDMIQHITGTGSPQPQPGQDQVGKPPAQGQKQPGKQSDAGQGAGQGGQIDPNQVPQLANIFTPGGDAAATLGLMPQTQGSFGWLLQMMQQQQMQQMQAQQGGGIGQIIGALTGAGPAPLEMGGGQAGTGGGAGAGKAAAGAAKAVVAGG